MFFLAAGVCILIFSSLKILKWIEFKLAMPFSCILLATEWWENLFGVDSTLFIYC